MRARLIAALTVLIIAGCDRMITPRHVQQLKDADAEALSGDAVMSRAEATRLRNENLTVRKELHEVRGRAHVPTERTTASAKEARNNDANSRTYVVQRGDTLASISRKFFKTSTRWKQILDANRNVIDNPKKLAAGQTLVIPARTSSR